MTQSTFRLSRYAALLAASAALAFPLLAHAETELTFKSGQTWRGDVNQVVEVVFMEGGREQRIEGKVLRADKSLVVVESTVNGRASKKAIFFGDIRSMKTVAAAAPTDAPAAASQPTASGEKPTAATGDGQKPAAGDFKGVIVLPIEGTVGLGVRDEDLIAIGKEADKLGEHQIIILEVDSPGGSILEAGRIHVALMEIKKRHRVIAWIKEAISAAAFTALHCDEIYFMTNGTMGSMTGFNGGTGVSITGAELQAWLDLAGEAAEAGGRDANMAQSMIRKELESSVDFPDGGGPKDAIWRRDAKGKMVIDTKDTMLCFNSSNALACGVSDGTADNTEELAKLLDLPEWKEATDVGRRMHADLQRLIKLSEEELPKLMARFEFKGAGSGDPAVVLGSRIQVIEELIRWNDRCKECCQMRGVPPKEALESMLEELKQELARVRKAQRDSNNNNRGGGGTRGR